MRHQTSGLLHQMVQHCERLGRQQDALVGALRPAAPQTLVNGVEPEWRELFHNRALRPPSFREPTDRTGTLFTPKRDYKITTLNPDYLIFRLAKRGINANETSRG